MDTLKISKDKIKVNIDEKYFPKEELKTRKEGIIHYTPMYASLNSCFTLENSSLIDIGCRDGWLLNIISENSPTTEIAGIDYFSWMRNAAPGEIQFVYYLHDMRDDIKEHPICGGMKNKFNIVLSTEVGEHIDRDFSTTFLQNLSYLMKDEGSLIMSWCERGGDKHGQHLNPLKRDKFFKLMDENGFTLDHNKTWEFFYKSYNYGVQKYYLDSNLSVWKKKCK